MKEDVEPLSIRKRKEFLALLVKMKVDGPRDLKAKTKAFELTTCEWPRNGLPFCGLTLNLLFWTRETLFELRKMGVDSN